ncbi:hypothetical protein FE257_000148 [Aspergillus nanangensis]|uniref:DUF7514 domain-containing protein n=1 Tax=Aspergillus nanangensis TaxID=2582783 RepID=A0AAD4CYV7_ASPNN|nr:hypothetical protein FE257_000148 [Aspergillus nanangensis]
MSSVHDDGANFWGVLINADKSPAPLLEHLCLGIAHIISSFDNYATADLTPERLAAFYRKVGGNYDVLFLETKSSALSFIYQRLGCFHSIQPSEDPYIPPSIPALQPNGFVRWQTIQLLLDPEEHWQYLQHALDIWDIRDASGDIFPKTIPRDAFPEASDTEMVEWHESVSRRFEFDFWKKNIMHSSPPNFGAYHHHFHQKDTPTSSPKTDDEFAPNRNNNNRSSHRRTPTMNEMPQSHHHQRRKSAEFPARRAHSTYFRRPEDFRSSGYASPRAPSPPMWSSNPSKKANIPTFSRPVSPSTVPMSSEEPGDDDPSDASSENSEQDTFPRPSRHSSHNRCYQHPPPHRARRHLSPPRTSARRHSHEAYARKPRRELSPDPDDQHVHTPRRYTHREHPAHQTRQYDSDGARRSRAHHRPYEQQQQQQQQQQQPVHSRSPGVGFREPAFNEQPAEVPVYTRAPHPRFANGPTSNAYFMRTHPDMEPITESRRHSYRGVPVNMCNNNGSGGSSGERTRFPSGNSRGMRWGGGGGGGAAMPGKSRVPVMVEPEYPSRGRRATEMDTYAYFNNVMN